MDFSYHRSIGPMMGVLAALGAGELLVMHVLVALWSPRAAWALSVVSLAALLWLVALIRSFARRPVRIADGLLTMRIGLLRTIAIPLDRVAGLRAYWDAASLKAPGVVNMALIAWPNVMVDVAPPLAGRRGRPIGSIAHRLDDAAAFAAALRTLGRGDDRSR